MTPLRSLALAAFLAVPGLPMAPLPAASHHGWSSFETTRACYIQGTVTDVRWDNPHSEVTNTVDRTALPDGFHARPVPQGANPPKGEATLGLARPYER